MLREVRFVLVRPHSGGNVGAAARALKNMGFGELWLVEPRHLDEGEARRLAHGAGDVLEAARRVESLAGALADCRWSVGTTRRAGRRRGTTLAPRTLAEAACAEPGRRPLALVFGPEEDGLASEDLAVCDDVLRIPVAAAQPSLNLAQAVLIVAYELFVAALAAAPQAPGMGATLAPGGAAPAGGAPPLPAPDASAVELAGMYAHLEEVLLEVGFARPDTAPHRMLALRRILGRARPRPGDVRLLRGICRQVLWAVRSSRPPSEPGG